MHIIRYTFKQPHFNTPTVGHWAVEAANGKTAESLVRSNYPDWVKVEYIASLTH